MGKSLAELRAAAASPRLPTRSMDLCLAQDLVARIGPLAEEKGMLENQLDQTKAIGADGEPVPGTARIGDPRVARLAEVNAAIDAISEEMREHTGTLTVRAIPSGEWRRWTSDHPPRRVVTDPESGTTELHPVDRRVTGGYCNGDDLANDLYRYVVSWNDQPVSETDWQYLLNSVAPGDLNELCALVVEMHEGTGARAPKVWSTSSSGTGTPEPS